MKFASKPKVIAARTACLRRRSNPLHSALEPTGDCEWAPWEALDAVGLAVRQLPPGPGARLCPLLGDAGQD